MKEFDPNSKASTIAADIKFVWRTVHHFKWTETPGIILKKVLQEFSGLSPDEREVILGMLVSRYGLKVVKDNEETVALKIQNVLVPIV